LGSTIIAQESAVKIPKRAGLYSAILPGAGQVYTKKYWKVPIIYAGLITSAYYINESHERYNAYKNAALSSADNNNSEEMVDGLMYSYTDLKEIKDHYRRNREVSALLFTLTYLLNIVDASVSAHLFDYDVSDDLSLHIQPIYFSKEKATGLLLSFNL
tara:strand:+ start:148 stop:621 length:474 start_codon:yes stop_codon:yes gene_type:complete